MWYRAGEADMQNARGPRGNQRTICFADATRQGRLVGLMAGDELPDIMLMR